MSLPGLLLTGDGDEHTIVVTYIATEWHISFGFLIQGPTLKHMAE